MSSQNSIFFTPLASKYDPFEFSDLLKIVLTHNPLKCKFSIFKNPQVGHIFFSKVCVVGTLNLSQEMSDKMPNESGQFIYTKPRKRHVCGQN